MRTRLGGRGPAQTYVYWYNVTGVTGVDAIKRMFADQKELNNQGKGHQIYYMHCRRVDDGRVPNVTTIRAEGSVEDAISKYYEIEKYNNDFNEFWNKIYPEDSEDSEVEKIRAEAKKYFSRRGYEEYFAPKGYFDYAHTVMSTYHESKIVLPILKLLKEGKKEEAKALYIQSVLETQVDEQTGKISIIKDEQGSPVQKKFAGRFYYSNVRQINDMISCSELSKDLLYEMVIAEERKIRSDAEKKARFNFLSSNVDVARVEGFYEDEEKLKQRREPFVGDVNVKSVVYDRNKLKRDVIRANEEYAEKAKAKIAEEHQRHSNNLESVLDGQKGKYKESQISKKDK